MLQPDVNAIRNFVDAEKSLTPVQKFNTSLIYANDADKTFSTYELSELKELPKSLFYDAATSDGVYRGLFAYYVLGKNGSGGVKYATSEKKGNVEKITPQASRNPTAKQIIDVVTGKGTGKPNYMNPNSQFRGQIYNVKDFIFCKYYGIIPNNRMLTLRRFAHPVLDSLKIMATPNRGDFVVSGRGATATVKYESRDVATLGKLQDPTAKFNTTLPVAQLVTFFGGDTGNSLNDILQIDTGLNWTMETQETMKNEQSGDPGLANTPYGDLIKSAITSSTRSEVTEDKIDQFDRLTQTLLNPSKQLNALERALLDEAVTAEGPLSKKIFVNINTVNQMNRRAQGLSGGTNGFTLTFQYTLSSAGQINSKLLFLDLMTNILSVGADYGQFLTPEIRIEQTTLGLGFPGGPQKYAQSITDPVQYVKDAVSQLLSDGEVTKRLNEENSVKDEMGKVVGELKKFAYDPSKGLDPNSQLYKSLSVMISDLFLKKVYYSPLMLSGYPTGEWHLTIGNPLNPIAMMGNLICKNVKVYLNDTLGPDDFPTEIKATFTMEPGRQRHRGDYESMFNRGNGRLYLGQLVASRESTQAYINQKGLFPNDTDGKDIYDIVNDNIDPLTGIRSTTGGNTVIN